MCAAGSGGADMEDAGGIENAGTPIPAITIPIAGPIANGPRGDGAAGKIINKEEVASVGGLFFLGFTAGVVTAAHGEEHTQSPPNIGPFVYTRSDL